MGEHPLNENQGELTSPVSSKRRISNPPGYELKIAHHSLKFSSAHFLVTHEKCGCLHGHNYSVSVLIAGPIKEQAMVIDFLQIKKLIRDECTILDHKILVPNRSPFLEIMTTEKSVELKSHIKRYVFPIEDCVLLDIEAVTSELLASYFWRHLTPKLEDARFSVLIEETPGAVAKYGTL